MNIKDHLEHGGLKFSDRNFKYAVEEELQGMKAPVSVVALDIEDKVLRTDTVTVLWGVHWHMQDMMVQFPQTAKVNVEQNGKVKFSFPHKPLTLDEIRQQAAERFSKLSQYWEGDVQVTSNASGKCWYKLRYDLDKTHLALIGEDDYTSIADTRSDSRLSVHWLPKELQTERARQHINEVLKAFGSSTRIVKEKGNWLIARERLEIDGHNSLDGRQRSKSEEFKAFEVFLFHFDDAEKAV
jgi:hypothetical protein